MFGVLQSSFERAALNRVGLSKRASYTLLRMDQSTVGIVEPGGDQCPLEVH